MTTATTIDRLIDNPSKVQELEHWTSFLATLPPCSYLALYLQGSTEHLRAAMANDVCCELLPAVRRGMYEAQEAERDAIKAQHKAQEELATLQRHVTVLRRELVGIREDLRKAKESAQTLARCAAESFESAVHAVVDSQIRHR